MAKGKQAFKLRDVTRAIKGAKAAGIEYPRVKLCTDGSIEIETTRTPEGVNEKLPETEDDIGL